MSPLLAVSVVSFFYFLASTVVKVLIPLYMASTGASVALIGLVVGAQPVLPTILSVAAGAVADRVGYKRMILVGAAGMCVASAMFYVWSGVVAMVLAQLLMGIAELSLWLSAQAIATQLSTGTSRGRDVGYFGFAVSAGQAVAPLLSGLAADMVGYRPALLLALIFSVISLLTSFLLPNSSPSAAKPAFSSQMREAGKIATIPGVQAALLCTFTMIFTRSVRQSFIPVYLRGIGFSASFIGAIISLSEVMSTVIRLGLGALLTRFSAQSMLVVGMFGGIVSTCITPLIPTAPLLVIAAIINGLGTGINLPLTMVLIADETPKELRGLGMGIRMTGNRLAQLVNPAVFALVGKWLALAPSFYAVGVMLLVGNVVTGRLLMKKKTPGEAVA
jgi:MFS family permease